MIPGPTQVPPESLKAMDQAMFNHRSPRFSRLFESVTERLKRVIATEERLFIFPSSGTGAMEAAFVNTIDPGDKVLCVSIGIFGNRFKKVAQAFGGKVIPMDIPMGEMAHPGDVQRAVNEHKPKAVLITHNETSTGVTNPIEEIAEVVRDEALLLVDGISSIGAIPYYHDKWGIDCLATATQKALMAPPGAAILAMGKRAWELAQDCKNSRYYFDVRLYEEYYVGRKQTPATPPIPQLLALDKSLDMLLEKGMENIYKYHGSIAKSFQAGSEAMGLELFAKEGASLTVTSVLSPVDPAKLISLVREKHNVEIAGGKGETEGRVFRVGHMGHVSPEDILTTLKAIEASLKELGFPAKDGLPAAQEVLRNV